VLRCGAVDGQPGPSTKSAIRDFQQAQGLPRSGELDQRTLSALGVNENQAATRNQTSASSSAPGAGASTGIRQRDAREHERVV
jgi:peptidoglycan hydrolase-like protein with peptidoglycan-binding domain